MLDDPLQILIALFAALCIGLSKAGFSGVGIVAVVLFADLYGAKTSVGILLPLLIVADLLAYPAFLKHGSWRAVWKLLPTSLFGLFVGWWVLGEIDEGIARKIIGACVILMVFVQVYRKLRPLIFDHFANSQTFAISAGILGGFATMVANAAGPVVQLYLLSCRVPKMEMLGISTRLFLLINLIKVPLNARLALITQESLLENATYVPAVVLGIVIGKRLIDLVPQAAFEWIVVVFAFVAAWRLLWF